MGKSARDTGSINRWEPAQFDNGSNVKKTGYEECFGMALALRLSEGLALMFGSSFKTLQGIWQPLAYLRPNNPPEKRRKKALESDPMLCACTRRKDGKFMFKTHDTQR